VTVLRTQYDQLSQELLTMQRVLDAVESATGPQISASSPEALLSAFEGLVRIAQQPSTNCEPYATDHLRFLSPGVEMIQQ
jgi:hypothetical protein